MKSKNELTETIAKIADPNSPVGMDAVYVHALILEKLELLDHRIESLESAVRVLSSDKSTLSQQSEQT